MAKSESQLLREWASLLEADPYDFMGDIGRTSPHRGDPVMSPDLGGGRGPGGAGRGAIGPKAGKPATKPAGRAEPKLEPGARPKIERLPGETPRQAVDRARKELELKPEPKTAKPTPDARGRVEPSLEPIKTMKPGKRAPLPPQEKSIGQMAKDMPHKKKAAAAAAVGAGAYWLLNREKETPDQSGSTTTTVEPADNWGRQDPDYADEKTSPAGEVGGAGNEVPQGTATPPAPPASPKPDTSTSPRADSAGTGTAPGSSGSGKAEQGFDIDDREWGTRMTRENLEVYTKHPVTGAIYRVKTQNSIMESQQSNIYNALDCGTVRRVEKNSWRIDAWSLIPVSKLLKGI